MSMVKVDPMLDLDGAQLAFAAKLDNLLTFDIANTNNWFPTTYADLPEQLQPWVVGKVRQKHYPSCIFTFASPSVNN